jgi:steroid delta-isomerase-like uncharacterized protein
VVNSTHALANRALVRRYYEDLWNRWDLSLTDALLSPNLTFRGSLGTEVRGIRAFRRYARTVWLAFPDFHNQIDDMIAEGDRVVARLTYTGTHRGEILGFVPTGRRVEYTGIALFRIAAGKIVDVYVVADRLSLMQQLGPGPE